MIRPQVNIALSHADVRMTHQLGEHQAGDPGPNRFRRPGVSHRVGDDVFAVLVGGDPGPSSKAPHPTADGVARPGPSAPIGEDDGGGVFPGAEQASE